MDKENPPVMMKDKVIVMTADDLDRALRRMSSEIIERNRGVKNLVIIGVQRRGVFVARRLRTLLREESKGAKIPTGELDITLYRDDIQLLDEQPVVHGTSIPIDITGRIVVLADDVLFTGRTVRAALEALGDIGRPACVQLLVMVDRGHRELPIQPDYFGRIVPTSHAETVDVRMKELDGDDCVVIRGRE